VSLIKKSEKLSRLYERDEKESTMGPDDTIMEGDPINKGGDRE